MNLSVLALLVIFILFLLFREAIYSFVGYSFWKRKVDGKHNYNEDEIRQHLNNLARTGFKLHGETLPYGRANWFIKADEKLSENVNDVEIEYFGYSPIRSKVELEFREYGILLTQEGIFATLQKRINGAKKKKAEYEIESIFFPFKGLWKVRYQEQRNTIKFFYRRRILSIAIEDNEPFGNAIVAGVQKIIDTGYTSDLETGYIQKKLEDDLSVTQEQRIKEFGFAEFIGATAAVYSNVENHLHDKQINAIVNAPQGHGQAAEYVNNLIDKIKNPFLKVEQVGQNNAKHGADRIVGSQRIQTKYYSTARNTVNSAFEYKADGGQYKYIGMQIEVPKDQYNDAINVMKQRISEGKVPGFTNPKDAYKVIRKGHITYNESKLVAQGGNITSLKFDAIDGAVQSIPVAGISFIIVFAQAKWAGQETSDAVKTALKAGARTLVVGAVVYAGSQQMAKVLTARIAEQAGKKIMAQAVAKRAGLVISFSIIVVPNLFNSLSGRISKQQLLKNTLVAGSGFAAGVATTAGTGAMLGSIFPGIGNAVGLIAGTIAGIFGAILGSFGTKKILDQIIKDDRVEMFAQLKEEYIDVVMSISLTEEEFEAVQQAIFNKKLESKLKDMFKHKKESRQYARTEIVEVAVVDAIKSRSKLTEEDVLDAVKIASEEYVLFAN